jgi:hypothetical protein
VARLIVPGPDPIGLLGTLLVGVIGAVIGGWLADEVFAKPGACTGSPRYWSLPCSSCCCARAHAAA